LGTLISYGIFIFSKKNELIFFRKMKISWEISVPKLALKGRKEKKKMRRGWSSWLWNDVAGRVWRPREERMDQIAPPCRSGGPARKNSPEKDSPTYTRRAAACLLASPFHHPASRDLRLTRVSKRSVWNTFSLVFSDR
jgi:hypothetical protein